jgi:L-asparaginase
MNAMLGIEERKLRLIAMGGTIGFATGSNGAVPQLGGRDLVINAVEEGTQVDSLDLSNISSIGIADHHLLTLSRTIDESISDGYAGIVVTHGTDTLEETAYFLALTLERGRVPIVLTGAMRHSGLLGYDGPANLRAALRTAEAAHVADAGPVVVLADQIHAARFVTKSHATRLSAFTSASGPIGQITEDRALLWFQPRYQDFLSTIQTTQLPRVELLTMAAGVQPVAIRAIIDTAPGGLVIEGFGGGHIPPALLDTIDEAISRRIPVVAASRCGDGPTLRGTYGVPGTEIDLQSRGVLMAGAISGLKARLRLTVALASQLRLETVFPVE